MGFDYPQVLPGVTSTPLSNLLELIKMMFAHILSFEEVINLIHTAARFDIYT
jgi:hypothetical protein